MDVTTELRWFGSGAVPEDAADWFGVAEPYAGRIDWYASAGAAAGLGLKVRAGSSLELKARRDEVGVWSFGERASGLVQTWVKWAVPLDPGWDGRSLGQGWIAVEKRRRVRRFAIEPGPSDGSIAREVGAADALELGCDAELTDLRVDGSVWWTLAFESFGDPDGQRDALRATIGAVLAGAPNDLALVETASSAYPGWLASFDEELPGS